MSRSKRKHPISGITTAESEKNDKVMYHREYRRVIRQWLQDYEDASPMPHFREYSNPYAWSKDGKIWRGIPLRDQWSERLWRK